ILNHLVKCRRRSRRLSTPLGCRRHTLAAARAGQHSLTGGRYIVRRSRASAADMSNTINQVSPIASSTSSNWLKEAQAAIAASESAGGMLGALAASRSQPGSLKAFLAQSQNLANGFSLIAQGNVQSSLDLTFKAATDAYNKRIADRLAAAQAQNAQPVNYTPPKGL